MLQSKLYKTKNKGKCKLIRTLLVVNVHGIDLLMQHVLRLRKNIRSWKKMVNANGCEKNLSIFFFSLRSITIDKLNLNN